MQFIGITSEALQAAVRRLLPSQQGFGEDLQASNVITPIIDLTPTAEGSVLGVNLQTALAFGSQTAINASGSTVTIANSPGFYRIFGISNLYSGSTVQSVSFNMSDGLSTKLVLRNTSMDAETSSDLTVVSIDFNVFLGTGESISVTANNTSASFVGSVRQIASVTGELVNPSGFVSQ